MKKLKLLLLALILGGCTVVFDPLNYKATATTSPDVIAAIEALNKFAVAADAKLKQLGPTPAPTALVKK